MVEHVKFASMVMLQLFHFHVNELRIFKNLYCHKFKRNTTNMSIANKAELVLKFATKSVGDLLACSDIDFYNVLFSIACIKIYEWMHLMPKNNARFL